MVLVKQSVYLHFISGVFSHLNSAEPKIFSVFGALHLMQQVKRNTTRDTTSCLKAMKITDQVKPSNILFQVYQFEKVLGIMIFPKVNYINSTINERV